MMSDHATRLFVMAHAYHDCYRPSDIRQVPFAGSLFGLFKAFDQKKCPLDTLPESCLEDEGVCGTQNTA